MGEARELCALFPEPRRALLTAIFNEPARWWTLAELAAHSRLKAVVLAPQMKRLLDGGLVREKRENGQPFYQPNSACRIYAELHAIVTKLKIAEDGAETILVVEDQAATARITRILLESWGYRVLEAHTGDEAIDLFDMHGSSVDLLLTDMLMPGLDGPQLAGELLRRKPDLRVVLMSGCAGDELVDHRGSFLQKPFNPAGLSDAVRRELDRRRAARASIKST